MAPPAVFDLPLSYGGGRLRVLRGQSSRGFACCSQARARLISVSLASTSSRLALSGLAALARVFEAAAQIVIPDGIDSHVPCLSPMPFPGASSTSCPIRRQAHRRKNGTFSSDLKDGQFLPPPAGRSRDRGLAYIDVSAPSNSIVVRLLWPSEFVVRLNYFVDPLSNEFLLQALEIRFFLPHQEVLSASKKRFFVVFAVGREAGRGG